MFCYGMIPTTNKATRVAVNTATAIDHIMPNVITNADLKT